MRCHASAPASVRADDGKCNHILGDVPGPLIWIACSARAPKEPGDQVWIMCPRRDCRTWNVFERMD